MRGVRVLAVMVLLAALPACTPMERRSQDPAFVDQDLERQAIARINGRRDQGHVNVTAFNRHLLLTGEVQNEAVRADIGKIAAAVPNVAGVSNELVIGEELGIGSQSRDSLVNSDVKLRLAKNSFGVDQVKVVTEGGTVFLMGRVSRRDARNAADLASTTKGVQRVVMVFEYQD